MSEAEREEFLRKRRQQLLAHLQELTLIKQRIEYARGYRTILDATGQSYLSGLALGGLLHFGVTALSAPFGSRLRDGLANAHMHAPKMAGNFATHTLLTTLVDVSMHKLRGKSDMWNNVVAGTVAGGILSMRKSRTWGETAQNMAASCAYSVFMQFSGKAIRALLPQPALKHQLEEDLRRWEAQRRSDALLKSGGRPGAWIDTVRNILSPQAAS